MAAPTVPSSLKKVNLNAISSREKTAKITRKNVLCPATREWPRVPKAVEDCILNKLTEKLSSVSVFNPVNKTSPEDKLEKCRVRSQLEIGTSCVFRALERDTLACILISGHATPAITVDHIISLGYERGCPLLCLDHLAPAVAQATKSKCLPLAIGFKKMKDNTQSDFTEIVALVKENVTIQAPKIAKINSGQDIVAKGAAVNSKTNKHIPIRLHTDIESEILEDLKRIFSNALVVSSDKLKDANKKKKQKKKRNLKDSFDKIYHCQFDIGKRTVTGILERGKIQLIFLSEEIVPVLLSETQSFSLLSIAAEMCPVVVLPGMIELMRSLCSGSVSVLGLKKLSSFPDSGKNFKEVIEKCLYAVNSLSDKQSTTVTESTESAEQIYSQSEMETGEIHNKLNILTDVGNSEINNSSVLNSTDDETDQEEDFSYLYVMKKDSKELAEVKSEFSFALEKDPFSTDYISLTASDSKDLSDKTSSSSVKNKSFVHIDKSSSAASKQIKNSVSHSAASIVEVKAANKATTDSEPFQSPIFSLCRSGDPVLRPDKNLKHSKQESDCNISNRNGEGDHVVGYNELVESGKSTIQGINYLALGENGKNTKKGQKRKMQSDDNFLSFTYTATNIKTMTSNPNKKKKKKKK